MKRLFLPVLLLCVAACAPTTRPISAPPDLEGTLLERLHDRQDKFSSLEGFARVRVENPERNVSATQVLLAEKPGKLRSEILSPFGTPMMLIATDGEVLTAYVPSEGQFYRGEASDANIRRLLRVPMRLEDLVDILLYDLPVDDYDDARAGVEDGSRFLLTLEGKDGARQEVLFDRDLQLVGARYLVERDVLLEVDYGFFSRDTGFPEEITVRMPQYETTMSVDFSKVESNVAIPVERFLLSPPPGVEVSPIPEPR